MEVLFKVINFLVCFGELIIEINRLLGYSFRPGYHSNATPVGNTLQRIVGYHNNGRYLDRDLEMGKLLLVKNLSEIEKYDSDLFKKFRRSLRNEDNTDNFYGARFETNIAASLIRKKIPFKKQESPDFLISQGNDILLGIECGSARIRKMAATVDLNYKVVSTVKKKSSKSYCSINTALFIDITNLFHTANRNGKQFDIHGTIDEVKHGLSQDSFGSVILFVYIFNKELARFESNFFRADNIYISTPLKDFLDNYYSTINNHFVPEFGIPREG